jgi:hypothetical protein
MADESGLSRNRRYIVWDTEKASLNKLQTNISRINVSVWRLTVLPLDWGFVTSNAHHNVWLRSSLLLAFAVTLTVVERPAWQRHVVANEIGSSRFLSDRIGCSEPAFAKKIATSESWKSGLSVLYSYSPRARHCLIASTSLLSIAFVPV